MQANLYERFPRQIPAELFNIQQFGGQRITGILALTIASVGAFAINIATGLFIAFSALILSFFFLLNHQQLADGIRRIFPPSKRLTARKLSTEAGACSADISPGK